MKCPWCDTDITGDSKCSKCGLDVDGSRKGLEVEYKDFKTSELLEIRHKKQADRENEEKTAVGDNKGEKAQKENMPGEAFSIARKRLLPFMTALAVALLIIAGVFLVFRYFILR